MIKALVWNENVHDKTNEIMARIYPDGLHEHIANVLREDSDIDARTATLQQPEHGLTVDVLAETDVLLWWGHKAHDDVSDEVVERVAQRVWEGLGLIVLHSGHFSKIFKRLLGTSCALHWRKAGERERLWTANPGHPIAAGLPRYFDLEFEEMYGEPFEVPEPMETVFLSWFQGGEVFRSGVTYRRGAGSIFYFRPGHETYPTYHDDNIGKVLRNAVRWAHNPQPAYTDAAVAPNVPVAQALEPIEDRIPEFLNGIENE